jgi:hypothetical protein
VLLGETEIVNAVHDLLGTPPPRGGVVRRRSRRPGRGGAHRSS